MKNFSMKNRGGAKNFNMFSARLYPKMTKKSLKKSKNPNSANDAYTACQVVSDSKLNVEHDTHIHFVQKLREMP